MSCAGATPDTWSRQQAIRTGSDLLLPPGLAHPVRRGGVRARAGGPLAEVAWRDRLTHLGYPAELLSAELKDRDARRRERRIAEARFPPARAPGRLRPRCGAMPMRPPPAAAPSRAGRPGARGHAYRLHRPRLRRPESGFAVVGAPASSSAVRDGAAGAIGECPAGALTHSPRRHCPTITCTGTPRAGPEPLVTVGAC